MARPTTDQVADREWGGLIKSMKARSPKLMMAAMKKYEDILECDKSSESATLRACSGAFDIVKYLNDLDRRIAEEDAKLAEEAENATGVAAAVAENKPMISLVAFDPSKKTG